MNNLLQKILGLAAFLFLLLPAFPGSAAPAEDYYWSYSGEITNIGTRSEGFIGRLYYRGKALSPKLGQIRTSIGDFKYESSGPYAWAKRGWLKVQKLPAASAVKIPEAKESQGEPRWISATNIGNAPRDWSFLPLYNYWVDPEYLQEFAEVMLKAVPEPEKSVLDELTENPPRAAMFIYKEDIFAKGSKSAGQRGYLFYNDKPIGNFTAIKTPIGSFNSVSSDRLWEAQGWFPAADIATKDTSVPFSKNDLKNGNYKGPKKAGTPSDWCYIPEMDTWISPKELM